MFDVCGSCQAIKSKSNAASLPKQASDSSYSPLLGAYVILGLMAAACATAATVLLTYLALMDRRCVPPLFWAFFHHAKRAYPPTHHTHIYINTHTAASGGAPDWGSARSPSCCSPSPSPTRASAATAAASSSRGSPTCSVRVSVVVIGRP